MSKCPPHSSFRRQFESGDSPADRGTPLRSFDGVTPVHCGMSRLVQADAESRGIEVAVFVTRGGAVAWLSSADSGRASDTPG